MTREECEMLILQKLKEIRAIAKEYDKSEEFYLSMVIYDESISLNNAFWETETPLECAEYNDRKVVHFDNN